ncbi:MAG: hypothetical protein Q9170_002678 [Blastenia crenularia]
MSFPSTKAVSSLARHRPAILAVTAIAAGLIVYAISNDLTWLSSSPAASSPNPTSSLHRSNAQRRRGSRRQTNPSNLGRQNNLDPAQLVSVSYEPRYYRFRRVYGRYERITNSGRHVVWLAPDQLPSVASVHESWEVDLEIAFQFRQEMEVELLHSFFAQEMPPGPPRNLSQEARARFVVVFSAVGEISASNTEEAVKEYESGGLQNHPARRARTGETEEVRPLETSGELSSADLALAFHFLDNMEVRESHDDETIADTESNRSDEAEDENDGESSQDQNLLNLLYRIAEDQAKKEGFVHRGVTCNSCNVLPIRGIRYRCANCLDYDLCEQCEALQVHDKTHLFYKIRVPAPFLGSPRQPLPVWYPGKPAKTSTNLTSEFKTKLSTTTGISDRQLDAYWEQFQCLAGRRYPNDPSGIGIAIDRQGFDQCFVPNVSPRPPPPNLVYDRMFSFYDTNDDGLIGFEEFLHGIACIANQGGELRARIFRAYDVDGDGFVDRRDFLRMFKAHYALTEELSKQVMWDDENFDEEDAKEVVTGSQPISSIFSGQIPQREPNYPGMGKSTNRNGDLIIYDGQGVLQVGESYGGLPQNGNIVTDNAEFAHFGGDQDHPWLPDIPRLTLEVDDDKWPQRWVTPRDIEEALGRVAAAENIEDRVERSLVLCASQERAQQEYWTREGFRRQVASSRWDARQFYLDGKSMGQPQWVANVEESITGKDTYSENDLCSLRIQALERNEEPHRREGYHEGIRRQFSKQWPNYPDLADIPDQLGTWIRKRFKWHNLAEALAPTRSEIPEATVVIRALLHDFFVVKTFVKPRQSSDAEEQGCADDSRSRLVSSTSSKSPGILAGELYEGNETSALAADIGREVIYQVTQESMNELLDPMFRLREDLAIEVAKTKQERSLHKGEIFECMSDKFTMEVMRRYREYQERWYESPREEREASNMLSSSQSVKFLEFMFRCLEEREPPDPCGNERHMKNAKETNGSTLQEATKAITRLDQSVAKEVHDESASSTAAGTEPIEGSDSLVSRDAAAAVELQTGDAAFDGADLSVGDSAKKKPLELLLADAGYGVVTPPAISPISTSSVGAIEQDEADPTLPHNRPNSLADWESKYGNPEAILKPPPQRGVSKSPQLGHPPPLSKERLLTLMLWNMIEEDDKVNWGGPGRLSLHDYEMIMEGDKGQGLGFVGNWVETAAF